MFTSNRLLTTSSYQPLKNHGAFTQTLRRKLTSDEDFTQSSFRAFASNEALIKSLAEKTIIIPASLCIQCWVITPLGVLWEDFGGYKDTIAPPAPAAPAAYATYGTPAAPAAPAAPAPAEPSVPVVPAAAECACRTPNAPQRDHLAICFT